MREYLLCCSNCNEYTSLGKYLEKEGHFEGEYSLRYNRNLHGNELLCRFLLQHAGHHLNMYGNLTEEYSATLKKASRFMDMDIDALLELELYRNEQKANELQLERGLGQLQLNVLHQLLAQEAERISKLPAQSSAEAQFMLGKEQGIKRAQEMLEELMIKTNTLYK